MNEHGFDEDNIVVLMDDGQHTSPTKSNMINAYKQIVADSEDGDTIFLHYSGKFIYRRPFSWSTALHSTALHLISIDSFTSITNILPLPSLYLSFTIILY